MVVQGKVMLRIEQWIQHLSVLLLLYTFYFGPIISIILTIYILFFTSFYPFMLVYIAWIYFDRETCKYEGREIRWVRNMGLWKYFANYFPQRCVKTADLSPSSNYIFCGFPHGILCSAAFAQFSYLQSEFCKTFPDIKVTGHTLENNFYIPFSREYALALGLRSVSRESIIHQLTMQENGRGIIIIVGGAAEAEKSFPGTYHLLIKNRKGFVKLAISTGTPLVPVFFFREVDVYNHAIFPSESIIHKIQQILKRWLRVAFCVFYGEKPFWIFPRRVPVTTVVGKPIPVKKEKHPSQNLVDEIHAKFMQELNDLFEEHKYKYLDNPDHTFLVFE